MSSSFRCGFGRGSTALAVVLVSLGSAASASPISEAEAIRRGLAQPDFIALGDANRAEADARVAGIRRFDNPEASVSRERVTGGAASETEWQAGIVQSFDFSGQRSSLRAAARAEAGAVSDDTARRRQERIADVRRAYAGCAATTERLRLVDAFAARLRSAERIVTERTRAGDTAGYDLRRLRVEARSADAKSELAAGEVTAECAVLSRLTGESDVRPTTALAEIAITSGPAPIGSIRADLSAREARLEAAAQQVRAAERARLPEIAVGLGYKRIESSAFTASGLVISLGARIPLFNNGGAAVAEARGRRRAREAELGLARIEAETSVVAAEARSRAAVEAALTAQRAAGDAARLGPIAEAAYQGGESGVVELVDAYRTARDAGTETIELFERAARARIDLELAQGSVFDAGL